MEEISNFDYINYIKNFKPKFLKSDIKTKYFEGFYFKNKMERLVEIKIKSIIKLLVTSLGIYGAIGIPKGDMTRH